MFLRFRRPVNRAVYRLVGPRFVCDSGDLFVMEVADNEKKVVAKVNKVMDCADDNADDNICFIKITMV